MISKSRKQQQKQFQVFIQSPDPQIPSQTLTLNRNLTLHHLKLSLLSQSLHYRSSYYFTYNGKPLTDSSTIHDSHITPLSTLILRTRLSGGGGDGGATGAESRDCYLNMYAEKKPDKVDPNEKRLSRWTSCALSAEPLKPPCVVDLLGNVFNKEALVQGLLGKKLPKAFSHIKGLKDFVSIQLSPLDGADDEGGFGGYGSSFQCPITGLDFNGKYKFFAIRTCGHVLSSKALKEIKSSACLVCHKEFLETDKIVINGNDEDVAALRERMEEEKAKVKEKKAKKVKNGEVRVSGEEGVSLDSSQLIGSKHGIGDVEAAEKDLRKVERNGKVENYAGGVIVKGISNGSAKRFKAAIAPKHATKEVYASIFTSSKKSDFKETYSCRSLPLGRN